LRSLSRAIPIFQCISALQNGAIIALTFALISIPERPVPDDLQIIPRGHPAAARHWRDRLFEIGLRGASAFYGMGDQPARAPVPGISIAWPRAYSWAPFAIWLDYLRTGLSDRVTIAPQEQLQAPIRNCEIIEITHKGMVYPVIIDCGDSSAIDPTLPDKAFLYFKMQYSRNGYPWGNVLPGGYTPAGSNGLFKILPALRRIRDARKFEHEVHGRFGAAFGFDRRKPYLEALSGDPRFKFTGGFAMLRPSAFLTEVARSRVLIDLPGQGDFCFRLIDYMAIGSCIVAARHGNLLPADLVDGREIMFVDDARQATETCVQLLAHPEKAEELAANARAYFDRHLTRAALADYYLNQIMSRLPN